MENQPTGAASAARLPYEAPAQTRIGHVHLQVTDLDQALGFYCGILGFKVMQRLGDQAAFISAGGYHHHIGLNTWNSLGGPPPAGTARGSTTRPFCMPRGPSWRAPCGSWLAAGYPLTGAADHGVSEALYLDDPDGNGVELYWDRPRAQWPRAPNGEVQMYTHALDLNALLAEATA